MDLKSFSNTEPYAPYRDEGILKESDVKDAINEYSKMSNDQLMMELAKQIGMQKEKGQANSMLETIERIKPFLNEEQRSKMENILKQVNF